MTASARLVIAAVLVAAVLVATLLLPGAEHSIRFLHWVQGQGALGPVILGGATIVACVLLVPKWVLGTSAGFLFGMGAGLATASTAIALGAGAAFLVGRTLARPWVARRVAADRRFQALDRAVGRQGFKIVLLSRLSPLLPFNLLNYAFGLTTVSLPHFLAASWIGMLPGTTVYVYLGSIAKSLTDLAEGRVMSGPAERIFLVVGLVVTLIVAVLIARIANRALRREMQDY